LQSWFKEKHGKQINLDAISKQEAPQLLKHFFLEIRQAREENMAKNMNQEHYKLTAMAYEGTFRASMSTGSRQLRPPKIFN